MHRPQPIARCDGLPGQNCRLQPPAGIDRWRTLGLPLHKTDASMISDKAQAPALVLIVQDDRAWYGIPSVGKHLQDVHGVGQGVVPWPGGQHHAPAENSWPNNEVRTCARLNPLLRLGLGNEPSRDDGDHRNPDVRGEENRGTVVHDVEPAVAAHPGEQPLDMR
jgi:hypothetical protein